MVKNLKIDCVIVTYNKLSLLKECIKSIQTQQLQNIFVIDNNSNEDTYQYLEIEKKRDSRIIPIHLTKNLGGAGGFNRGIRTFFEKSESDYVWVLDDDTIANPNSLEKLIKPLDQIENVGFLASNVRWTNGAPSIMNVPALSNNWNQYSQKGYLQIKTASFVSVLFPRYVVYEVGLPISDFFIWCDDTEYTSRITKAGFKNYFVSESCITHKMAQNVGIDIKKENNKSRITRYFLRNRNSLFMSRIVKLS